MIGCSPCPWGTTINGQSFNIFCYADDILLASITSTGLQSLIESANHFILENGLTFNPSKTECCTFGKNFLSPNPKWYLDGVKLTQVDSLKYLGVLLSHTNPSAHIESRMKAARNAFYALKGTGVWENSCSPDTIRYVFNTAVRPVLTYGIQCMDMSKSSSAAIESAQAKLLKSALGLHKFCRSTPLLDALKIQKIEKSLDVGYLKLLSKCLSSNSKASDFYYFMMNLHLQDESLVKGSLIDHVFQTCSSHNISFVKFLFKTSYSESCVRQLKKFPTNDGMTDSVHYLLYEDNFYRQSSLNMLLIPF